MKLSTFCQHFVNKLSPPRGYHSGPAPFDGPPDGEDDPEGQGAEYHYKEPYDHEGIKDRDWLTTKALPHAGNDAGNDPQDRSEDPDTEADE
jgi:hypothetical protein